jgi:hypothetical protein
VDDMASQSPWKEYGYRNTRGMKKLEDTEELGYGMYPVQLRMLCQQLKVKGTLSSVQGSLRLLPTLLDTKVWLF